MTVALEKTVGGTVKEDFFCNFRDSLALVITVLSLLALGLMAKYATVKKEPAPPKEIIMAITMQDVAEPPPAPVQSTPPEPTPQPVVPHVQVHAVEKPVPVPTPTPSKVTDDVPTKTAVAPPEPVPVEPKPPPPVPEEPVRPQPVVAPPSSNAAAEKGYEGQLKGFLEARKAYPTGRQVSLEKPEGAVGICYTLSHAGKLISIDIIKPSGSIWLDQAARKLVGNMEFPPFPDDAFRGQEQRRFCATLNYSYPKDSE